jgi:hypothetical protein
MDLDLNPFVHGGRKGRLSHVGFCTLLISFILGFSNVVESLHHFVSVTYCRPMSQAAPDGAARQRAVSWFE